MNEGERRNQGRGGGEEAKMAEKSQDTEEPRGAESRSLEAGIRQIATEFIKLCGATTAKTGKLEAH